MHVVRDTEAETRMDPESLISKLDGEFGLIRERARRQQPRRQPPGAAARAPTGSVASSSHRWTGRARSGCGAALVGPADQVMSEIEEYRRMGIRGFILPDYPHLDERAFGARILPAMRTCSLPEVYGRMPARTQATPLAAGERR